MGAAADRLGRVGKRLRTLPEEGVQEGTAIVRRRMLESMVAAFGSDRKLSGLPNGRPQTVRVTRRSRGQLVEGRIMAGPRDQRAPLFWRDEGTRAGRRGAKVGRYGSGRAFRGHHPGTDPTYWWSRAVGPVLDEVSANFERLYREAVNRR
jgi:hypothetical protein